MTDRSTVVYIACCPVHGLHGKRTTCFAYEHEGRRECDGTVQQVAMVPVVDPERGPCGCGCGHPKRPCSDYATDACRTRDWKKRTGYTDPRRQGRANAANARQTSFLQPKRPGGRQVAYRRAVGVLTQYLIDAHVADSADAAWRIAERVLSQALPPRQQRRPERTAR